MRSTAVFVLIILSFILTGTMGPLLLEFMEHGSYHLCPISSLLEKSCFAINNALNSIIDHISGWQKIFQAIISFNPALFAIFVLTAFSALIFKKSSNLSRDKSHFYRQKYLIVDEKLFNSLKQFLQWLALLNKPDSYVLRRAFLAAK